jgi:hypothetical protein
MTPQDYLRGLTDRLSADGCGPQWDTTASPYLIGYRADIRALTKMHLFTIAAVVPEISLAGLEQFTEFAMDTALRRRKGLPRGLQTGVAVFPALISDRVDPAAAKRAAVWQRTRFACMGRPTVVDTAQRTVSAYRGRPVVGMAYTSYLRKKNTLYFPEPQA